MDLVTPTVVEHDGWILGSASSGQPTKDELLAQLGKDPSLANEQAVVPPAAVPLEKPAAEVELTPPGEEPPTEEPAVPAVAATPAETPATPATPKRRRTPQARIDEVTAKQRQAEDALAAERLETTRLRALVEGRPAPAAEAKPATPAVATTKPKPVWDGENGYEAQGKSWEQYQADRDEWRDEVAMAQAAKVVEDRIAADRKQHEDQSKTVAEEASKRAVYDAHQGRLATARAKYRDFDDKVEENLSDIESPVINTLILHSDQGAEVMYHLATHREVAEFVADADWTRPMVDGIRKSPNAVKVIGHLHANPAEFLEITKLHPVDALLRLGRLSQRLEVAPTVSTSAKPITNAKPPLRTVVPGTQTAGAAGAKAPEDIEFSPEWIVQENRREAAAARARR